MNTLLKPYPGRYLHGIDLNDWYPCWNLSLSGRLFSPDFLAAVDKGVNECHTPIKEVPIEQLENGNIPHGAYTPRGRWFIEAAARIKLGNDTQWAATAPGSSHFSKEQVSQIVKMGEIELSLEKQRRITSPDAPSRLSALYLAENNEDGRYHIKKMLGFNIHIIRVKIPYAISVVRVDTKWFDLFSENRKNEYLENYWAGTPYSNKTPTWEFLVDGLIEADDSDGLNVIKEKGAKLR